jgi:hypothetical protein
MKVLTAKVVSGKLDVPDGTLEEGATLLLPEAEEGFTGASGLTIGDYGT